MFCCIRLLVSNQLTMLTKVPCIQMRTLIVIFKVGETLELSNSQVMGNAILNMTIMIKLSNMHLSLMVKQ